jgi:nucleotide-binding universal stress UspA family protein
MPRIIIGVDGSERSEEAIAFARAIAAAGGAHVTVANAYRWEPPASRVGGDAYVEYLRHESERILRETADPLRDLPGLELRSVPDRSPARGLQSLAEQEHADLIVVGSSHTGRLGRVFPGSTAERLLHGAPCPVVVVPVGRGPSAGRGFETVACAWDGTPESEIALVAAEDLARAAGASLRVVRVFEPQFYATPPGLGYGYPSLIEGVRRHAGQALHERLAHLSEDVEAVGELREGDPRHELVRASESADVLVMGSRGYGPLRAVLLGGVSGPVIRSAACPVMVVPRGAEATAVPVFAHTAAHVADGEPA